MRRLAMTMLWLTAIAAAQDDVLPVERQEDTRDRDRAVLLLKRARCDFVVTSITPKELCRHLSTLTGDRITFLFAAKGDAAATPAFDLRLKSTSAWSVMAATQLTTGLRFVWRSGLVMLVGKDEVKPATVLRLYNLRAATMPLKNFPGPVLGLRGAEEGGGVQWPPEEDSGNTVSGFTADGLEALIKAQITPEAWADTASLDNQNGLFVVRHTAAGHRAIAELLDQLGVLALPRR